ncbi:MAG: hypothetical protein LBL08_00975 [Candidatus Nomurabacteria bacterium]|jgi:pilin isopeptide linkage protein|nr:hypothetical protein [Candidatus Nomurabacteria bacterium]
MKSAVKSLLVISLVVSLILGSTITSFGAEQNLSIELSGESYSYDSPSYSTTAKSSSGSTAKGGKVAVVWQSDYEKSKSLRATKTEKKAFAKALKKAKKDKFGKKGGLAKKIYTIKVGKKKVKVMALDRQWKKADDKYMAKKGIKFVMLFKGKLDNGYTVRSTGKTGWIKDKVGSKRVPKGTVLKRCGDKTYRKVWPNKVACINRMRPSDGMPTMKYSEVKVYKTKAKADAEAGVEESYTVTSTAKADITLSANAHVKCGHGHYDVTIKVSGSASGSASGSVTVKASSAAEAKAKGEAEAKAKAWANLKADANLKTAARAQINLYIKGKFVCPDDPLPPVPPTPPTPPVQPLTFDLVANKEVSGKTAAEAAGLFSYNLTGTGGVSKTATNAADGTISFNGITVNGAGTYTYSINEVNGHLSGWTYGLKTITATVVVVPDGVTALKRQSVTWTNGDHTFFNSWCDPTPPPEIPPNLTVVASPAHLFRGMSIPINFEVTYTNGGVPTLKLSDITVEGVAAHISGLIPTEELWDGSPVPEGTKAWVATLWSDGGPGNVRVTATARSIAPSGAEFTSTDYADVPVRPDDFGGF